MCLTGPKASPFLNFKPLGVSVPLTLPTPEVKGYSMEAGEAGELTQEQADAASETLERVYGQMSDDEKAVFGRVILRASRAID